MLQKNIMFLKINKRKDLGFTQMAICLGKWPIFVCSNGFYGWWFRLFGKGLSVTTKPLFSIREKKRKSLKIGKYYIHTI